MGNSIQDENQVSTSLLPISNISLHDLFENINPKDAEFLKYVPDGFLSDEQKQAKAMALEKEQAKYGRNIDDSTDMYADSFSDEKQAKKREKVETLAAKLGLKVNYSDEVRIGKYNPITREITLNPNLTAGRMYMFVFKHEFVHDLENRRLYKSFKNYLFSKSNAFTDFCETELISKYDIEATGQEAVSKLREMVFDIWSASDELSEKEKAAFDKEAAEREMVADFVAERLLGGLRENGDYEQESYDALIELAETHRSIFQRFVDWVKDIINIIKGEPTFKDMADELQYLNERLAKVYDSRIQKNNDNTIKFSLMNSNNYSYNVDKILDMPDAEALENYREGNFVSIMKNTPEIILKKVKGAEDLEVIISFHSLYLETRHNGILEGTYHNLGEKMKLLPELISNPDAIVRMKNGRINILTSLQSDKGNNGIISIELNAVKDINNEYNKYNLVITVFSSNDKYVLNNLMKQGDYIEYKKEDLSQVNPQLHKSLTIFNEKSSISILSEKSDNVNKNSSVNESHSVFTPFSEEFKAEKRKKYAERLANKYGGYVQVISKKAVIMIMTAISNHAKGVYIIIAKVF